MVLRSPSCYALFVKYDVSGKSVRFTREISFVYGSAFSSDQSGDKTEYDVSFKRTHKRWCTNEEFGLLWNLAHREEDKGKDKGTVLAYYFFNVLYQWLLFEICRKSELDESFSVESRLQTWQQKQRDVQDGPFDVKTVFSLNSFVNNHNFWRIAVLLWEISLESHHRSKQTSTLFYQQLLLETCLGWDIQILISSWISRLSRDCKCNVKCTSRNSNKKTFIQPQIQIWI